MIDNESLYMDVLTDPWVLKWKKPRKRQQWIKMCLSETHACLSGFIIYSNWITMQNKDNVL